MRIAKTLQARVAALEGDIASDDVAHEIDLSGFDGVETERISVAIGLLRSEGAHALSDEQLHLLMGVRRVAKEPVA
jgi:hypothetical protein